MRERSVWNKRRLSFLSRKKESDEASWKLINIKVDTFVKVISTLSILGAIAIAWVTIKNQDYQAEKDEIVEASLDMKLELSASPLNGGRSLLISDVLLINKGTRTVYTFANGDLSTKTRPLPPGEGCTLSIVQHSIPASNGSIPTGLHNGKVVVPPYNILRKYDYGKSSPWHEYTIKPGMSYKESEVAVVEGGALYEVVARFYAIRKGKAWTNTDVRFIYID